MNSQGGRAARGKVLRMRLVYDDYVHYSVMRKRERKSLSDVFVASVYKERLWMGDSRRLSKFQPLSFAKPNHANLGTLSNEPHSIVARPQANCRCR